MNAKTLRDLQTKFLVACTETVQPIEDILSDLNIEPVTLLNWMGQREFSSRLHGMRRFLRKARDLQLEVASYRAAGMLSRTASDAMLAPPTPMMRAACVDVIRLARDSRARRKNHTAEAVGRDRLITHPDVSDEEATQLIAELTAAYEASKQPRQTVTIQNADGADAS